MVYSVFKHRHGEKRAVSATGGVWLNQENAKISSPPDSADADVSTFYGVFPRGNHNHP